MGDMTIRTSTIEDLDEEDTLKELDVKEIYPEHKEADQTDFVRHSEVLLSAEMLEERSQNINTFGTNSNLEIENTNMKDLKMTVNPKRSEEVPLKLGWSDFVTDAVVQCKSVQAKIDLLKEGMTLLKLRDKDIRGPKLYRRKYTLDVVNMVIHWTPHKDSSSSGLCSTVSGSDKYNLADINEVREGFKTDIFNKVESNLRLAAKLREVVTQDTAFSIIFNDDCNTPPVDLVAPDQASRDAWINVINHILFMLRNLSNQKEYEMYLKKKFRAADKNNSGSLSVKETAELVKLLNVKISKEDLQKMFNESNTEKSKRGKAETLDEDEFVAFYYSLMRRPEIE